MKPPASALKSIARFCPSVNVISRRVQLNEELTVEAFRDLGIDREADFLEMQEEMAIQVSIQGFVLKKSQSVLTNCGSPDDEAKAYQR